MTFNNALHKRFKMCVKQIELFNLNNINNDLKNTITVSNANINISIKISNVNVNTNIDTRSNFKKH